MTATDVDDRRTRIVFGREAILSVVGDIDIASVPALRHALEEASRGAHGRVVVDAALVSFMDAAGVGVLLSFRRRLAGTGRDLVVRNPSPAARRVLEVVGLGELVENGAA